MQQGTHFYVLMDKSTRKVSSHQEIEHNTENQKWIAQGKDPKHPYELRLEDT